ncbi:I78 family peptidase inhibitor [Sphingobium sp. AP49]|uniref:I78 family peptidase inhibitor n=1 Tax=Sphingobium sp. AP49 TaxID=1144307 RepID=UPI0005632019|nr:I78 family peptidase inhibitor [Sphingobium sp. AP49]WHO41087.1 I78 family peptidase inhibitor [Sphingobium sp. AP49]
MPVIAMMLLPLTACGAAGSDGPGSAPPAMAEGPCKNDGLDRFTGQKASAELGAELLKASGAKTLRWGGPNAAMTMDFRPDRLTVSYDQAMIITSARCG